MNQSPEIQHPSRLGYVPALDGLRGVAILLVMGNHFLVSKNLPLLRGGFVGVDIFFVLSGYLITTLLCQEFTSTGSLSLRQFYLRRALRLGPALVTMLAVVCSLSWVLFDPAVARKNCQYALIALFYASNWVKALTQKGLGVVAQTWSLSIEEQFYLIWPFILWWLLRKSKGPRYAMILAVTVTLLSWASTFRLAWQGAPLTRVCFGLDSRSDTLMIGCLMGLVLTSGSLTDGVQRVLRKILAGLAPLSLIGLVAFAITSPQSAGLFYFVFKLLAALSASLIMDVLLNPASIMRRLFELKWLVWLGSVSYGLYLWHWPIFYVMQYVYHWPPWRAAAAGIPLAFSLTILSFYGLEKPILKFKKRFTPSVATPMKGPREP